jgi:hypothetical protein
MRGEIAVRMAYAILRYAQDENAFQTWTEFRVLSI